MKSNLIRWLVVTILIILVSGTAVTLWTSQHEDLKIRDQLLTQARLSSVGINAAQVAALAGSGADLTSPDYQALKIQMAGFRAMDPDIRFAYLIGRRADDTYFFFVDSEPPESEDYSPPGQEYPEVMVIDKKVFSTGVPMTEGPASDRWGTWVSSVVPITDPETGKTIAIYGMDVDARDWNWQIFVACLTPVIGILLILMLVLTFFFIQQRNERERRQLEASGKVIRESEEKFHSLYSHMIEGSALHKLTYNDQGIPEDYIIIEINPAFEKQLGISRDTIIGKTSREAYGVAEPPYLEIYAQVALTGEPKVFETYFPPLAKHFSISAYCPYKGSFATIFEDITEREQIETALRESEGKFRNVLENIPDLVLVHRNGIILYANPAMIQTINYTPDEVINTPIIGYIVPEYLGRVAESIRKRTDSASSEPYEIEILRKGGGRLNVIVRGTMIEFGGSPAILNMLTDITERKRAEAALHETEERYRSLFDRSLDCVYIYDFSGNFIDANQSALTLLGYTRDEITSLNFASLLTPDQISTALKVSQEILVTGTLQKSIEYRLRCKDGTYVDVETTATLLYHEGKPYAVQGIAHDITERKKTEEKLKKFNEELERGIAERTARINASLEEKVVLLREIHHRVKNNLQILISLLNLQSRTITDPQIITALKESTQRIRAMSMVHEKLYSGSDLAHINFISYLSSLAKSQVEFYRLGPHKVTLEITGENILLDINTAIPLGLVMNELLSNALKYAFPGDRQGTIRIDVQKKDGQLEISLADDGVGLPEGFDYTTSQSLGLRLVHILIEQLSGKIELKKGKGTTFNIIVKEK
jgi:PAS domain S-box-containing protein